MKFTSDNQPTNRGRKVGSMNATTAIIRKATPSILKKLIDCAVEGDIQAATTLLKYSLPSIKPESNKITISVPEMSTLAQKSELIVDAALSGKCCPSVASQLISSLANVAKIIEVDDLINRIEALEIESKATS